MVEEQEPDEINEIADDLNDDSQVRCSFMEIQSYLYTPTPKCIYSLGAI